MLPFATPELTSAGSADANKAVTISMVQPAADSLKTVSTFHPKFTYPIFGEEERIFGYQGLNVDISFAAHDLHPNVNVYYDKKFTTVGDTAATDIKKSLADFLPESMSSHPISLTPHYYILFNLSSHTL